MNLQGVPSSALIITPAIVLIQETLDAVPSNQRASQWPGRRPAAMRACRHGAGRASRRQIPISRRVAHRAGPSHRLGLQGTRDGRRSSPGREHGSDTSPFALATGSWRTGAVLTVAAPPTAGRIRCRLPAFGRSSHAWTGRRSLRRTLRMQVQATIPGEPDGTLPRCRVAAGAFALEVAACPSSKTRWSAHEHHPEGERYRATPGG
jgi:hypothetical protein